MKNFKSFQILSDVSNYFQNTTNLQLDNIYEDIGNKTPIMGGGDLLNSDSEFGIRDSPVRPYS